MREKTGEGGVVCTASGADFSGTRKPFEKKDQGTKGLKRRKLGRIKGIKVIYDKRYTERL